MRKILLYMQMALDGVVTDVEHWMNLSDEIVADALAYYQTLDAIIIGHNTYSALANYWLKAETESDSHMERAFAKKINSIRKIVISQSKAELIWPNSEQMLVRDSPTFVREIQKLRNSEGKNISVESGVRTWQAFIEHGLFDELWIQVHPVVAASGSKLFDHVREKMPMQLIESKTYQNGVVGLRYRYTGEAHP